MLDSILEEYPKEIPLKDGFKSVVRPLKPTDEKGFHDFFMAVPEQERMFIKHRVTDAEVIRDWCQNIDLGRNLPLLALAGERIIGDATLHQYRGRGLAKALVVEIIEIARNIGLEKLEAEFMGEQEAAIKMFGLLGFAPLVRLPDYVKDMKAVSHDYVWMGLGLETDEEYAGME